ncbi:sulfatase-like hydrolase/transferase [Acidobacteria bacterium AH-259-A15]|nr:sulfatase-like hydrolase/transferase [Acidobacteria bacterium AH-259-A15]
MRHNHLTRIGLKTYGLILLCLPLFQNTGGLFAQETTSISHAAAAAQKPNIVIMVADDLGWEDVSYHGGEIGTPNIDRLAKEGVELDRFYVAPVCSPTRAGLMTGRYPIRYGLMRTVLPPWRKGGLDTSEVTLAEVLKKAGYEHRGVFGKWHLGHSDVQYHPLRRGFTEFYGHYNGAIDYFTHSREGELDWHHNYETSYDKGYSTDLIADAAVRFIEKHSSAETPFFCYVPFNAPHSPFQAKPEELEPYKKLEAIPGDWPAPAERRRKSRRILGGMITSLDQGLGRILDAIDRAGIRENTLVLFFSDNGGVRGIGSNVPLRAGKHTVFEGGIRVAALLRWPKGVPGGRKVTAPLAYIDVLPTIMRIVGVQDHGGKPLDGLDVFDVLTGRVQDLRRELYSYIGAEGEATEQVMYMTPEWKLVVLGPNVADPKADDSKRKNLLFRIEEDPLEKTDLAAKHPRLVERMFEKVRAFRALQPEDAVAPYAEGREGFTAPKDWRIPGT